MPTLASGLPPLGELITDDPFWRYPVATMPGEGHCAPAGVADRRA
jgi:hypothetical protein